MLDRRKTWIWIEAAVSFAVGLVLVLKDTSAGWFFIILGIIYLGLLTRPRVEANPRLARWGLVGAAVLLGLLVVTVVLLALRR